MRAIRSWTVSGLVFGLAFGVATSRADPAKQLAPIPAECVTAAADRTPTIAFPSLVRAMVDRRRIVVLTIGSSVIGGRQGTGDYYELVERFLESTFRGLDVVLVQRGVSGELARDAAERIRLEVARSSPDVVFWQVGTADALAGLDPQDTGLLVRDTIRWLKAHDVDVVLIGLHYTPSLRDDPSYQAMRQRISQVARDEGVLRIRRYEVGETIDKLGNGTMVPASVADLTTLGNTCMAEYLARSLATGLFARRPSDLDEGHGGSR